MLGRSIMKRTAFRGKIQDEGFYSLACSLKLGSMLMLMVLFSGCATYKFQKGQSPYDQGYVVSRDNYTILEYTLGKDNTVPADLTLAKERFSRRRKIIEDFYKKMGSIENRFKMGFADYPIMMFKLVTGVFRLPFIGVSDYRYEHDPKYKEKIQRIEEQKDAIELARVKKLKDKMANYVQNDLTKEHVAPVSPVPQAVPIAPVVVSVESKSLPLEETPVVEAKPAAAEATVPELIEAPKSEVKPAVAEATVPAPIEAPKPETKSPTQVVIGKRLSADTGAIKAVISAKPVKGFSPLKVQFSGAGSFSPHARIVSYSWDFGDGDISTKAKPVNIYYSASFEPRQFTVTLTVQDDKGNTSSESAVIEVLNK